MAVDKGTRPIPRWRLVHAKRLINLELSAAQDKRGSCSSGSCSSGAEAQQFAEQARHCEAALLQWLQQHLQTHLVQHRTNMLLSVMF